MKKSGVCLTLFCLLSLTVSQVSAQDLSNAKVAEIRTSGLERISEQLVLAQIEVQEGQSLSQLAIARDIRRLYALNYFTDIKVDMTFNDSNDVILTYMFQEKRTIGEIKIIGNNKINSRQIRSTLKWKETDPFFEENYDEERETLMEMYATKGFPNATVDVLVEDLDSSRVKVSYIVSEGKKARIRRIDFSGTSTLTDRKLRKTMKTKRRRFFLGGKYDQKKFEYDLEQLIALYGDNGHLEAGIGATNFDYSSNGKKLNIAINVQEGPLYHVGSLDVANNIVYDKDELLRPEVVKVQQGNVHNKGQVQKDADLVQQGYKDSGYTNARVTTKVTLDREAITTNIVHDISEGDLKYVREIPITGNSVTRDDIIRQRVLSNPGDRYDGAAVRATERTLNNSQFFDNVHIFADDSGIIDTRYTDLFIDVEEGKTGTFQFGGGYSTEEKVSGFFEIKKSNFDILNWPTLQGGGQEMKLKVSIGDRRSQYFLSFNDPQIAGYPISFGFDIFNETHKVTGGVDYTQETSGMQIYAGKNLSHFVTLQGNLRYEDNDISELPFFASPTLRRYRGGSTTISTAWSIVRNTLDNYRDPTDGSKHTAMLQIAGLGGDNEFGKFEHDSIWYWSPEKYKKWTFSYHTREGLVDEYGSSDFVPLSDRFFCGGSSTVRGYDTRDIGPKVRRWLFWGKRDAIGGELMFVNNLEVKYKLADKLRLYAFADAGTVWETASDFDFGDIKYSAGLGLGIDVPRMGPIRVDYGFPLNPDSDQGSGKLHLMTGFRF